MRERRRDEKRGRGGFKIRKRNKREEKGRKQGKGRRDAERRGEKRKRKLRVTYEDNEES